MGHLQAAAAGSWPQLGNCGAAELRLRTLPLARCLAAAAAREKSDLVTTTATTTAPRPVWVAGEYMNTHAGGKRKH